MPDFGKIGGNDGDVPIQNKILHKNHLQKKIFVMGGNLTILAHVKISSRFVGELGGCRPGFHDFSIKCPRNPH